MTATCVAGPAVLAGDHCPPVADGSQAWPAPTGFYYLALVGAVHDRDRVLRTRRCLRLITARRWRAVAGMASSYRGGWYSSLL